ncbi:unnamed protein product, partial [Didymodactylos carnosus]
MVKWSDTTKTMDAKIAALSNQRKTDSDEQLSFVTFNYNATVHSTTKQIPFEMVFGKSPKLPFDRQSEVVSLEQHPEHITKLKKYISSLENEAKKNIIKSRQQSKKRYDLHRSNPVYNLGDLVLVKTINNRRKFDVHHEGPFKIAQRLADKTYIIYYFLLLFSLLLLYSRYIIHNMNRHPPSRYHQHRDISPTYRQLSNPTSEHQRTSNSIFKHQSSSRSLPKHRHEIQQPQTAKQRRNAPWYNDRHPHTEECQRQKPIHNNDCLCPRTHRPYKAANDQWGLQMAIARTFGQYLDKSSTLANWAVGLDTVLGAYMSPQERERLMQQQVRNYDQTFTDMVLHVQNEEPAVQDQQQQTDNQNEPSPQVLQQDHDSMNLDLVLHVQNEEPLEQTAEEEDNHHYVQGHQQPHLQSKIVIPPRSKIV